VTHIGISHKTQPKTFTYKITTKHETPTSKTNPKASAFACALQLEEVKESLFNLFVKKSFLNFDILEPQQPILFKSILEDHETNQWLIKKRTSENR